jgi:hypothetical protein
MVDSEAVTLKIRNQIESLERGLAGLKDGSLRTERSRQLHEEKRAAEMIGQCERLLTAWRAMLSELQ